jgi:hypothetical protein
MRSDISHAALSSDLVIAASKDPSELSNLYTTSAQKGEPECTVYNSSCDQLELPRGQAKAYASARYSNYGDSSSDTGGCACRTPPRSFYPGSTFGAFATFAVWGLYHVRRRRSRRGGLRSKGR